MDEDLSQLLMFTGMAVTMVFGAGVLGGYKYAMHTLPAPIVSSIAQVPDINGDGLTELFVKDSTGHNYALISQRKNKDGSISYTGGAAYLESERNMYSHRLETKIDAANPFK